MQTLKINSKGGDVTTLQIKINHATLGAAGVAVTGIFDTPTQIAVQDFQNRFGLVADGIVGPKTWAMLETLTNTKPKFLVSVHAGHGGIDPITRKYMTADSTGKKYQHKGLGNVLGHSNDGFFYEGVENRIAANAVANQLRQAGIFCITTHHQYLCDYHDLGTHRRQTLPYIEAGFRGYTHSFHSNAAPSDVKDKEGKFIRKRTQAEMDEIIGGCVFTTEGNTLSDQISQQLLDLWLVYFGDWVRIKDKKPIPTPNSDYEANFQVIREIEKLKVKTFGAILEEFGFFTSAPDVQFITNQQNRHNRVRVAVETAIRMQPIIMAI